jgi:hypothetical protein
VSDTTYRNHAKYRTSQLSAAFHEFIASETAARPGAPNPSGTSSNRRPIQAMEGIKASKRRRGLGEGAANPAGDDDHEVSASRTIFVDYSK